MRLSEFSRAVDAEFGDRGSTLVRDLVLADVGYRTAEEALDAGVPVRDVWFALCVEADVPLPRRHGVGLREPRG